MPKVQDGNWWIYDSVSGQYRDSDQKAQGDKDATLAATGYSVEPTGALGRAHTVGTIRYTEGGATSGTNAGSYQVTFAIKETDKYEWNDGRTRQSRSRGRSQRQPESCPFHHANHHPDGQSA